MMCWFQRPEVNMGCPKSFSVKGGMGAALLDKPEVGRDRLDKWFPPRTWLGKSPLNGGFSDSAKIIYLLAIPLPIYWLLEVIYMSKIGFAAKIIAGLCLVCSVLSSHTFFWTIFSPHLSTPICVVLHLPDFILWYPVIATGRGGYSDVAATCPAIWEVADLQDPHAAEHRRWSDRGFHERSCRNPWRYNDVKWCQWWYPMFGCSDAFFMYTHFVYDCNWLYACIYIYIHIHAYMYERRLHWGSHYCGFRMFWLNILKLIF